LGLLKKIRKDRGAISPVIATIIIVAVTIAVSVAVAGWMMGLWGGLTKVETMRIFPESSLTASTNPTTPRAFSLVVKNTGTADATITSIKIGGLDVASSTPSLTGGIPVTAGAFAGTGTPQPRITGTANASLTFTVGSSYEVLIYTAAGNVYPGTLVASA